MGLFSRHIDGVLADFSAGDLSATRTRRMIDHAKGCERCGVKLNQVLAAQRVLQGSLFKPAEQEQAAWSAAAAAVVAASAASPEKQSSRVWFVAFAAAAATCLALFVVWTSTKPTGLGRDEFGVRGDGKNAQTSLRLYCAAPAGDSGRAPAGPGLPGGPLAGLRGRDAGAANPQAPGHPRRTRPRQRCLHRLQPAGRRRSGRAVGGAREGRQGPGRGHVRGEGQGRDRDDRARDRGGAEVMAPHTADPARAGGLRNLRRGFSRRLGILSALSLLVALPAQAQTAPRTRARALVVAVNASGGPGLAPLRFADDDGLRWAETLTRLGVETSLLTLLDDETARVATLPEGTLPPTLDALRRTVARLKASNEEARAAGELVETWVVYVGHGVLDDAGRASLTLQDGKLDQKALYAEIVDALKADYVHLVVDACHAAGVVGRRGQSKDPVVARIREKLAGEALKSRPGVGALFAESEDGETHEWSRLRSGVFSFLARSALLGAADVNGDGAVEYSELDAYLGAALQKVSSYPVRLSVHSFAPPADRRRPLSRLGPEAPRLASMGEQAGEGIIVEDEKGVPLAGFHRLDRVALLLPPRPLYWLRTSKLEAKVALADVGAFRPDWKTRAIQSRGAAEDELERGLLSVPFGRAFYEGFVARSPHVPVSFVEAEPQPVTTTAEQRGWSFEAGLMAGTAALGLSGVGVGVDLAARRSFGLPSLGARVGYLASPNAGPAALTVHRGSAELVVGVEGPWRIRPFGELGLGWVGVGFSRDGRSVGDPLGLTGHLAAGVGFSVGPVDLRLTARLAIDAVQVDAARQAFLIPAGELGVLF
ncbi:MAG: hypothetical protein QM765_40905 [Myxococcales bacterium]